MSYRIQVDPEAAASLRALRPHAIARLGRELADRAAILEDGGELDSGEVAVDDWKVQLWVDHQRRILQVVGAEQHSPTAAEYPTAEAQAAS